MTDSERVSDDFSLRGEVRRVASALLKLAILVGIVAGGVWAYVRVDKRRAGREQSAAEQKAAVGRLVAAGGDGASHEGRLISVNFTRRPADDEAFAALAWFTSLRETDARPARGHQRRPAAPGRLAGTGIPRPDGRVRGGRPRAGAPQRADAAPLPDARRDRRG